LSGQALLFRKELIGTSICEFCQKGPTHRIGTVRPARQAYHVRAVQTGDHGQANPFFLSATAYVNRQTALASRPKAPKDRSLGVQGQA
jgi:hypothetical protein